MALIDIRSFSGMRPALACHLLDQAESQRVYGANLASGEMRPMPLPESARFAWEEVRSLWLQDGVWRLYRDRRRFALSGVAANSRLYSSAEGGGLYSQAAGQDSVEYRLGLTVPRAAPVREGEPFLRSLDIVFQQGGFVLAEGTLFAPHMGDWIRFSGDIPEGVLPTMDYVVLAVEGAVYRYARKDEPNLALELEGGGRGRLEIRESGNIHERAYTFTVVNEYGEESAPGPPSDLIRMDAALGLRLGGLTYSPGPDEVPIRAKRIYRTATGTESTDWFFVAEIPADQGQFTDMLADADLAEMLPSLDWEPPSPALRHLVELPGGVLAAHDGKEVWLSQPFMPYAWPQGGRQRLRGGIVALAASQRTLFAFSHSLVHALTVEDTDQVYVNSLDGFAPCLGPDGVVTAPFGVLFPSSDGLYLVSQGASSARNLTEGLMGERDWKQLNPSSFLAAWFDTTYMAFYEDVERRKGALLLDFGQDGQARMRLMDSWGTALQVIPERQKVFMARQAGDSGMWRVYELFAGGEGQTISWVSKKFVLPAPVNMACILIDAGFSYAEGGKGQEGNFWGGSVGSHMAGEVPFGGEQSDLFLMGDAKAVGTVRVVGDEVERASLPIRPGRIMPLPGGYSARVYELELSARAPVRRVAMATTSAEILQG